MEERHGDGLGLDWTLPDLGQAEEDKGTKRGQCRGSETGLAVRH